METAGQRSSMSAMQLALEALESDPMSHAGLVSRKQAITALRQVLETKREWVGLTEKEWHEATGIPRNATLPMPMLKGIEKALREKNHGQP